MVISVIVIRRLAKAKIVIQRAAKSNIWHLISFSLFV